jgi:replication factor A2
MFGTKRYINATHIRPIKDHHETHFHLLEAMAVLVFHEKGMVSMIIAITSNMMLDVLAA